MKKILVSDYDRTIYVDDINTKKNIEAINKFRESNIFVVATGRSYKDFRSAFEKFNIKCDYYIYNYGAEVLDKDENLVYDTSLSKEEIEEIKNYFKDKNCEIYYCQLKENLKEIKDKVYKIVIVYDNKEEELKDYSDFIKKYNYNVFTLENHFHIEIISSKVNKASAIKNIAQKEDVGEIYVIGDSENDIPMIKEYSGFAVENAKEEVKNIATKTYKYVYSLIDELLEEV